MTMHPAAPAIVAAARACVGARFRPQGRGAATGLDCVGVALAAAAAIGLRPALPPYRLGSDGEALLGTVLAGLGCVNVAVAAPGDLIEVAPAPQRRHLAVMTPAGVVHAHAGLGRVVEGPLDPAWHIVALWRLPEG